MTTITKFDEKNFLPSQIRLTGQTEVARLEELNPSIRRQVFLGKGTEVANLLLKGKIPRQQV